MKIRWPFKKISHKHWIGINLSKVCPSAVIYQAGEVISCISFTPEEGQEALTEWLKINAPSGIPTVLVLDDSDYELLLVEAPEVPDDELSAAIEFRIADLLPLPVEDMSIQAVRLPDDAYRGRLSMAHVIASPNTAIQEKVDWAESLELNLKLITVPEFCFLNLLALLDIEQGIALLELGEKQGNLRLYQSGALYLTRHVEVGIDALEIQPSVIEEQVTDEVLELNIDKNDSSSEEPDDSEELKIETVDFNDVEDNLVELELNNEAQGEDRNTQEKQNEELDISEYVGFAPKAKVNEEELQNLILEIQRSLDYYESQLGMGQITKLWLVASGPDLVNLVIAMEPGITAKIEQPNFSEMLNLLGVETNGCRDDLNHTAVTLGGALAYAGS